MLKNLWLRTVEVAKLYTGTFITVMILNQLLFFGFCLNPICLIAAMPHVLFITVIIGTWINNHNRWGRKKTDITGGLNKVANGALRAAEGLAESGKRADEFAERFQKKSAELLREQEQRLQRRQLDESGFVQGNVERQPLGESNRLVQAFSRYGIDSLWHITHRENIPGIVQHGLLCKSSALKGIKSKHIFDISNQGVQVRRQKPDPIYNRKIHDYVPLYLRPRNPMLFSINEKQNELCLIEISLGALTDGNYLICDGNAAAANTRFFNDVNSLKFLPWDVLNADFWSDFEDGKRKRCAEVLIKDRIDSRFFKAVHVYSEETDRYLYASLSQSKPRVQLSRNLFFSK